MFKRKLIVLDIDRTLVHACPQQYVQNKWNEWYNSFDFDMYKVYIRPNMQQFLDFLFDHFDVGVFTAGGNEYADVIVEHLFAERKLQFVLSSDHCDECFEETNKSKCMQWLLKWYNKTYDKKLGLCDIKLIDDSHMHMMNNPSCCYLIPKFIVCYDESNQSIDTMKDDNELILIQEILFDWKFYTTDQV